jgi:hypothetical protein
MLGCAIGQTFAKERTPRNHALQRIFKFELTDLRLPYLVRLAPWFMETFMSDNILERYAERGARRLIGSMETVTLTKEEKARAEEGSIAPAPTQANEIVKASGRFWLVTVANKTVTVAKPDVTARMVSSPEKAAAARKKRKNGERPKR